MRLLEGMDKEKAFKIGAVVVVIAAIIFGWMNSPHKSKAADLTAVPVSEQKNGAIQGVQGIQGGSKLPNGCTTVMDTVKAVTGECVELQNGTKFCLGTDASKLYAVGATASYTECGGQ